MESSDEKHTSTTECILYGILTIILWVSCLTILLPFVVLLKLNTSIQKKFFSFVYVNIGLRFIAKGCVPFRRVIFEMLKAKLDEKKDKKPLKILEIGIGSGANFEYYPEGSSLIAVDMNPNFKHLLQKNLEEYPEVKLERIVHTMAEDMSDVVDDSVDVVVSTFVFCSTLDSMKVLKEIRRVLKPGGVFLFLEHIVFPNNQCGKIVQVITNPLWKIFFAGCCIDRDTENKIKNNGFSEIDLRLTEIPKMLLYLRPMTYGIATK